MTETDSLKFSMRAAVTVLCSTLVWSADNMCVGLTDMTNVYNYYNLKVVVLVVIVWWWIV